MGARFRGVFGAEQRCRLDGAEQTVDREGGKTRLNCAGMRTPIWKHGGPGGGDERARTLATWTQPAGSQRPESQTRLVAGTELNIRTPFVSDHHHSCSRETGRYVKYFMYVLSGA